MRILVTGGAGFIGSHTCVSLLESGYEVAVLDNYVNSSPAAVAAIEQITGKKVPAYEVDLLDLEAVQAVFQKDHFDGVIHFAGLKAVGESVSKPLEYYHNNITGNLNLCRAMREADCKVLVFSSSATVYGPVNPIPYVEGMPTSATSPYGWTKVMIEQMLTDLAATDPAWSISLLRYFNPVGAHESGLIGEDPNGIPNNLVPYIAKVATGELPYLRVFGGDYDTPDGTGVRDYIHVMDLAEGHVKALEYALSHTGVEAVNLGSGKGTSVLELFHAYERACGKELAYQICPRRAGDLPAFWADPRKAEALYHWHTTRDLDSMCRDSWRFTSSHMG